MTALAFDTLKFARRLRESAGFTREHAEAAAEAFADAVGESDLSTKADVESAKGEVKTEIAGLRAEVKADIAELRAEMKADVAELRAEVKAEMAELRAEVKADIASVRSEIAALRVETKNDVASIKADLRDLENRMTIKLGGMLVVMLGILLGAARVFTH